MPVPPGSPPRKKQPVSGRFEFVNNFGAKPPAKPTGRHAVALGPHADRPDWGDFRIKIYVRSFAPPKYFALGNWVGDNRGFTTALDVTSRLTATTTYYLATQRYLTQAGRTESIALYTNYPLYADSETYVTGGSGRGTTLNIHLCGNDKAVLPYIAKAPVGRYQSPDIDVHVSLTITTKDLRDGTHLLSIMGRMKGDQFPAAECFVDVRGVKVFLGVSPARYDPHFAGPFTALFGDRQATMAPLAAQIIVNHFGDVMGVVWNGRKLDVDRYNQAFLDTKPVDLGMNRHEEQEAARKSGDLNRGPAWWNK